MAIRIRRGSGNVFTDVGFPPAEAAHLLIRTDLMLQIERVLKAQRLTQAKAAKVLGVTQPRVSDLVRGRVDLFSIDTLVEMLARLGVSVTLRTKRSHRVA
ncbi:MAG: XRE family transcriptional regulator [Armatimonadetes bacterium]|nr:XRE family transcriptional regulator [Armatimonadota bacterium]